MQKSDLVVYLVEQSGLSRDKADLALAAFLEQITNALSRGESVSLPGFGSFDCRQRQARLGRHPRTGEPMAIAAHRVPLFRPGKNLREALNG
jgi:DNA-binding protein HU-beta